MAEAPVSAFISYSRTDSAFIDRLEADLRAYGFDTWVDRQHLEGGADWARQIEQQIVRCEALVVALSPDAITSTWVRREITFALNAGKRIIPIIARPVASTPIEIVDLQYIDLSADYMSGLQDLRVALLKVRTLPPPPRPAQAPQPLLTLPDVSDPLKGLVEIPPPPPAPNPDLNALFMQAQSALARGNFDLAEALLRQITEQEPDFGNGLAGEELQRVRKQLEPTQIDRLRKMADDAHTRGAWGQEIGALRALATRLPEDEAIADRLSLAEECQKWAWLYDNARGFAQASDRASTSLALTRLWEKVPFYGDPAGIAPPGLPLPTITPGQKVVRPHPVDGVEQGHVFAEVEAHKGSVNALRWAPDGKRLVTASVDKIARVAQTENGDEIYLFTSHTGAVNDITWSPDSRQIASASDDGTVRVWRATDGTAYFTFYLGSQTGSRALTVDWNPREANILAGGREPVHRGNQNYFDATSAEWSTSSGNQNWHEEQHQSLYSSDELHVIRYSLDGTWFLLSGSAGIEIRAAATPRTYTRIIKSVPRRALSWAPNGGDIAIGRTDRTFVVQRPQRHWGDGVNLREVFTCGGHAGQVSALAWSPDGSRIASASDDGVRLWDATDGRLLFAYGGHSVPVTAIDWSPDSTRIASGDNSGALHIWKA